MKRKENSQPPETIFKISVRWVVQFFLNWPTLKVNITHKMQIREGFKKKKKLTFVNSGFTPPPPLFLKKVDELFFIFFLVLDHN